MTDSRTQLTRRSVVALAAVGLAGCTTSSDESTDDGAGGSTDDGDGSNDDGTTGDSSGDSTDQIDVDPETPPEVDHAAYRAWLLGPEADGSTAHRFEYTDAIPDGFGDDLPGFFDVSSETADAHLVQSPGQIVFGSFDADAIVDGAAADEAFEVAGTTRGYGVLEPNETIQGPPVAVGPNAIIIGEDVDQRLDARYGAIDRLEEAEPEFARLFEELPHETTVTGDAEGPESDELDVDTDAITVWGVSTESPSAETMTWVFVFADEDALTEDVLGELEEIPGELSESEIDGRIATVVGTPPELPDEFEA